MLPACTVNHTMPSGAMLMVCGSFADLSGNGYSVVMPVFGSSLPIRPRLLPVNQILPSCRSSGEPVRARVRRFQRVFADRAGLGIDAAELVGEAGRSTRIELQPLAARGSCGREP